MKRKCAALAAWLVMLAPASALATTPWTKEPAFPSSGAGDQLNSDGTAARIAVTPGASYWWRPEDTDPSPTFSCVDGCLVVWDDGAGTVDLVIEMASGDSASTGTWKTYTGAMPATGDCETSSPCPIRWLPPGVYRLDTATAAADGQAKITGLK
jgi:hypothetical protein